MLRSALNLPQSACPQVSLPVRGALGASSMGHFEHFEQREQNGCFPSRTHLAAKGSQ